MLMQKVQRFGGAMFTPVMLFAFAGMMVGVCTLFTTEAVMGPLAAEGTTWHSVWSVLLDGSWTVFNQLPVLFAVALPIGLAKKQAGRCCMESLVGYLTLCYFVSAILSAWGPQLGVDFTAEAGNASGLAMVAGIKTLDMGMFGALGASGIVIALHNRLFDHRLPETLGVFQGSTFVYMDTFLVMLPGAAAVAILWPKVQVGMHAVQGLIADAGMAGVGVFVFLERALIPFGLHHLLYAPFYYDNVVVQGGIYAAWAKALPTLAASSAPLKDLAPWASVAATGWSKIFGVPGIALAFYHTARPERRKRLVALLVPITLTSMLCGVTEPIEFTFLFVAPQLFVVHAALSALLSTVMNLCGVVGVFAGGLIEMSSFNFVPLAANHGGTYLVALGVGLAFTGIYYLVFTFLIERLNLRTPGREDEGDVRFGTRERFRQEHGIPQQLDGNAAPSEDAQLAGMLVDLLGGPENVVTLNSCATRLRVSVRDAAKVADEASFRAAGALGVTRDGRAVQVIVGLSATSVCECVNRLLGRGEE